MRHQVPQSEKLVDQVRGLHLDARATVIVAQGIAELPLNSDEGYRMLWMLVCLMATAGHLDRPTPHWHALPSPDLWRSS
jgi:hypothetical protein